jgi:hypothetical protein
MRDLKGVSLRRAVAHRLDGFFAEWLRHLGDGTARIWSQVEGSLGKTSAPRETAPDERPPPSDDDPAPMMRVPMQQEPQPQPLQQQQQKKKET